MKNYYDILGIIPTADKDHIRKAYLEKVRTIHPDINPSAEAHREFILLKEAYDTLSNENKRAVYDQQLKQSATSGQNVKNFHYDFQSNLGGMKKEQPKPNAAVAVIVAILIFLLVAGGAAFFLFNSPSR
jgi:curved DNA-binding protein CbpA